MSNQDVCCPRFHPENWDEKTLEWKDKKFIQDNIFTLFYLPLNFGRIVEKLSAKVDKAGANFVDGLSLAYHKSMWKMKIMLAVDREIPHAKNISLSGKFYCKVYEGSFKNMGQWIKDFQQHAKSKQLKVKNLYQWYTTCPKCAKKYGKNYVLMVAELQ